MVSTLYCTNTLSHAHTHTHVRSFTDKFIFKSQHHIQYLPNPAENPNREKQTGENLIEKSKANKMKKAKKKSFEEVIWFWLIKHCNSVVSSHDDHFICVQYLQGLKFHKAILYSNSSVLLLLLLLSLSLSLSC